MCITQTMFFFHKECLRVVQQQSLDSFYSLYVVGIYYMVYIQCAQHCTCLYMEIWWRCFSFVATHFTIMLYNIGPCWRTTTHTQNAKKRLKKRIHNFKLSRSYWRAYLVNSIHSSIYYIHATCTHTHTYSGELKKSIPPTTGGRRKKKLFICKHKNKLLLKGKWVKALCYNGRNFLCVLVPSFYFNIFIYLFYIICTMNIFTARVFCMYTVCMILLYVSVHWKVYLYAVFLQMFVCL